MHRVFLAFLAAPFRVRAFSRKAVPLTVLLAAGLGSGPAAIGPACAAGPMGVDTGWVVDNSGNPLFTSSKATQLSQAETGWVRMEFRLVNGNTTWNTAALNYYDTVVNNARSAGLQVLGLIDNTSWPTANGQNDWIANNNECTGGNGDNTYIDNFASQAAVPIILHFHDRVKYWEIWNEPNAYTTGSSLCSYRGGTYIYPSNFSQLLSNTYADVKEYNGLQDVHLISGGVFGHSISGYSYTNAGAQYIDDTYNEGINVVGSFAYTKSHWGTYPLDGIGQHIYIDQGGVTTSSAYQQYLDWVRQAYTKYEGTGTSKHTFVTETGWQTTGSETQSMQDQNLVTAFSVFENGTANYVQTAIWFNWQDNPPGNQWYGVLDQYGSQKVSYNDFTFWEEYEGYNADGTVNTAIQNYYKSYGQATLGDPYDNGGSPFVHTWSGSGFTAQVQDCDGGSNNRLCLFSSSAGTYQVNNGFWTTYLNNGGIGYYGAPTDDAYGYAGGTRQDFQSGHYLTWTSSGGVVSH